MKLTTKMSRWYFWKELFLFLIPIILIVGTIDVFVSFMRCSGHPEGSAPCSINWILAIIYGVFLIITIICAVISAKKLRKIKKQIEDEFLDAITYPEQIDGSSKSKKEIKSKPKKLVAKSDNK